jgi:hypothetical protein
MLARKLKCITPQGTRAAQSQHLPGIHGLTRTQLPFIQATRVLPQSRAFGKKSRRVFFLQEATPFEKIVLLLLAL